MNERIPIKQEMHCFSLVEVAIVLIMVGLVIAVMVASSGTARTANIRKAYQQVVVPCVAAVHEALRQGATEAHAPYPDTQLDGVTLVCQFGASANGVDRVTITGAPHALQEVMQKNLADGMTVQVEGSTVILGRVDTPPHTHPTDALTDR